MLGAWQSQLTQDFSAHGVFCSRPVGPESEASRTKETEFIHKQLHFPTTVYCKGGQARRLPAPLGLSRGFEVRSAGLGEQGQHSP